MTDQNCCVPHLKLTWRYSPRKRKRQRAIERAIQAQDEIRKEIGEADLSKELREWRDERK